MASRPNLANGSPGSPSRDRLMLRLAVLLMPAVATIATFVASSNWFVWVLVLVMAGAIACAARPESHMGLGVIIVLALHWLAAVEDRTSLWTLVVAVSIAVFHTAMAASGVAAPAARWSGPMRGRWLRRLVVVVVLVLPAWGMEMVMAGEDLEGSALVMATALVVLTLGALVLRARTLHVQPER